MKSVVKTVIVGLSNWKMISDGFNPRAAFWFQKFSICIKQKAKQELLPVYFGLPEKTHTQRDAQKQIVKKKRRHLSETFRLKAIYKLLLF